MMRYLVVLAHVCLIGFSIIMAASLLFGCTRDNVHHQCNGQMYYYLLIVVLSTIALSLFADIESLMPWSYLCLVGDAVLLLTIDNLSNSGAGASK
jgi:cell division protein FtsW (lipid II flippase)